MENKKIILPIILLFTLISYHGFSQISNNVEKRFAFSLSGGGFLSTYDYGYGRSYYNINVQGEYKINKSISAVVNTGFNFKHFKEEISVLSEYNHTASTKFVLFEATGGINYYRPIQKNTNLILTANLGLYNERILFLNGQMTKQYIDEKWNSRFGLNGGVGFESALYNNLNWALLAKYHYVFNNERDMKFFNINLGLKYNF
jgi:hypothetical protein